MLKPTTFSSWYFALTRGLLAPYSGADGELVKLVCLGPVVAADLALALVVVAPLHALAALATRAGRLQN